MLVPASYIRKYSLLHNEISQALSKQLISTFSTFCAFRDYPNFLIEVTRRDRAYRVWDNSTSSLRESLEVRIKRPLLGAERVAQSKSLVWFAVSPPENHFKPL